MSDLMSWGDWSLNDGVGTALASVGSGLSSLIYGGATLKQNQQAIDNAYTINQQNYQAMKEQQKYERELQGTMFQREDNAIQRRAADMKKAGLSKALAAGAGAQAGPVVKSQVPSMSTSHIDKHFQQQQMKIALMTQTADIGRTVAQTKLLQEQTKKEQGITTLNTEKQAGQVLQNALDRSTLSDRQKIIELEKLIKAYQEMRDKSLSGRYWTQEMNSTGTVGKSTLQRSRYEQQLNIQLETARKKLGLTENELNVLKEAGITKGMGNYAQMFSMIKKMSGEGLDSKMAIQMLLSALLGKI